MSAKLTKTVINRYKKAHAIISRVKPFQYLDLEEFAKWFEGSGKIPFESFNDQAKALPQANHISDDQIKAWIYSFFHNPLILEMDKNTRERFLIGASAGMQKLSAYDAAVIAQEMDNPDGFVFSFKTAEGIRRSMLMKDMFTAIRSRPESRLREYARDSMCSKSFREVHEITRSTKGYLRTAIVDSRAGDWISGYGKRYAFLRSEFEDGSEIWWPILLVADDDENKESEYFYELGALCGTIPVGQSLGGCVIASVDPSDYNIHIKIVEKTVIEHYAKTVSEFSKKFWEINILEDKPMDWKMREERHDLDAETLDKYQSLATQVAKLGLIKKRIDAQDKKYRAELNRIFKNFAYKHNIPLHNINIPMGPMGANRGTAVKTDELQYIVDKVEDAYLHVFKKTVPNPDLMEAKLKEIGIDERHYCEGVPDAKLVVDFCEARGFQPPIRQTISFRMNTASAKGKEYLTLLEKDLASTYQALGLPVDDEEE